MTKRDNNPFFDEPPKKRGSKIKPVNPDELNALDDLLLPAAGRGCPQADEGIHSFSPWSFKCNCGATTRGIFPGRFR